MKTIYKVLISLCVGICLICVGISIGGLSQVNFGTYFGGFDFVWDANRIADVTYQSQSTVNEMKINVFDGKIEFIEGDYQQVKVEASQIHEGFEVYQEGDTLIINQAHTWRWFRDYDTAQIKVYIPQSLTLQSAKINVAAGNLNVSNLICKQADFRVGAGNLRIDGVRAQNMELKVGMGNASAQDVTIDQELEIDVGMGNAKLSLTGHEDEYNYKMKVGLGSAKVGHEKSEALGKLESHYGTTSKLVDVKCGLGSVKVEMEG